MPSITIKNIDPELYGRLKKQAAEHRRSINSEAIVCLERSLEQSSRLTAVEWIAEAREIRESVTDYVISDEELTRWKNEGRS
jgi:plasmid stability protein